MNTPSHFYKKWFNHSEKELKEILIKTNQEPARHSQKSSISCCQCQSTIQNCNPHIQNRSWTGFLANRNGRILFETNKNAFPWSNYLKEKWFGEYACGKRHCKPNTKDIPQYYKTPPPQVVCSSLLKESHHSHTVPCHCQALKNEEPLIEPELTPGDQKILIGFERLRKVQPPVIWILGHPHECMVEAREKFCKDLATSLNFKYISMDVEIINTVHHQICSLGNQPAGNDGEKNEEFTPELAVRCKAKLMSDRLLKNSETALNREGIIEMLKLTMIHHENAKGFVIDSFPCSEVEAIGFEAMFYPVTFTIYITSTNWPETHVDDQAEDVKIDVVCPVYFRRGSEYSEKEVERLSHKYRKRCLILQNGRTLGDEDVAQANALISKKLEKLLKQKSKCNKCVPICENSDCECVDKLDPILDEQLKILKEIWEIIRERQEELWRKQHGCGNDVTRKSILHQVDSFYNNPVTLNEEYDLQDEDYSNRDITNNTDSGKQSNNPLTLHREYNLQKEDYIYTDGDNTDTETQSNHPSDQFRDSPEEDDKDETTATTGDESSSERSEASV